MEADTFHPSALRLKQRNEWRIRRRHFQVKRPLEKGNAQSRERKGSAEDVSRFYPQKALQMSERPGLTDERLALTKWCERDGESLMYSLQ